MAQREDGATPRSTHEHNVSLVRFDIVGRAKLLQRTAQGTVNSWSEAIYWMAISNWALRQRHERRIKGNPSVTNNRLVYMEGL